MKALNYIAIAALALSALSAQAKETKGTLMLGGYETASDYYDGTSWEAAPANYLYNFSSSQVIYTADELKEIANVNGKITKVTFKYVEATPSYQSVDLTMNISLDDAQADTFLKNSGGKYTWMPFSDTCSGSWTTSMDNYYDMEETEIEITLDTPYEVKPDTPLVITTTGSTSEAMAYISSFVSYYYTRDGRPKAAATKCSDTQEVIPVAGDNIEHQTSQWSAGEFAEVPVVKFDFVYDDATDGIASVEADATEAVYYNLQGIRVAQPTSGTYVKVAAGRATKVAL